MLRMVPIWCQIQRNTLFYGVIEQYNMLIHTLDTKLVLKYATDKVKMSVRSRTMANDGETAVQLRYSLVRSRTSHAPSCTSRGTMPCRRRTQNGRSCELFKVRMIVNVVRHRYGLRPRYLVFDVTHSARVAWRVRGSR